MKKFMKVSLMTAGVLGAVGIIFCLIGGLVSGHNFMVALKNDAYMEKRFGAVEKVFEGIEKGLGAARVEMEINGISDSHHSEPDSLTVNGQKSADNGYDNDYHIEAGDIRELDLSLGAGTFTISEKDETDGLIDLYVRGKGDVDFYVKDNSLHVEGFKGNKLLIGVGEMDNQITLRIPKGMGFDEIDLEIGAGSMDICNLKARELDANVGAGELIIDKAEITSFSAEIGAGQLSACEMYVWEADVEVGLGSLSYVGAIEQELDAQCGMGNMDFQLKGNEKDHNYEIECSAGSIQLNGWEISAMAAEKYVNNGAASTFELSANMGNITLNFVGE